MTGHEVAMFNKEFRFKVCHSSGRFDERNGLARWALEIGLLNCLGSFFLFIIQVSFKVWVG